MWDNPWKYRVGSAVVACLLLVGAMLQLTVGPFVWDIMAWPVNIIVMVVLTLGIAICSMLRSHSSVLHFVATRYAAVPAIVVTAIATAIYGITNMRETLSNWVFVLLYLWMDIIVGFAAMKFLKPTLRNLCLTTSHIGLFVALTAATLGNADMQQLKMQVSIDGPEWRAIDDNNKVHELPFAIRLNRFTIDEYPPKLVVVDNETGKALPMDKPEALLLKDSTTEGDILGYHIKTLQLHDYATQMVANDTTKYIEHRDEGGTKYIECRDEGGTKYIECRDEGAATAVLVNVTSGGKTIVRSEWVSNGSYVFPFKSIRLSDRHSLVMPEREPKRYASDITIYAKNGGKEHAVIEVNKPYEVEGWKVYQLSYDQAMGRWSKISVLELVYDPWLPIVYAGIGLLAIGAIILLLNVVAGINRQRRNIGYLLFFLLILLMAICAYFFKQDMDAKTLMPALQSPWFTPHVVVYMFCYTIIGIATLTAIILLIKGTKKTSGLQPYTKNNNYLNNMVHVGLALMTLGMLMGALWAKEAWGHYWAWDPKETWAAATWLIYMTYIHIGNNNEGISLRIKYYILIIAFICLQMCWWGINYLPSAQAGSIHTYSLD